MRARVAATAAIGLVLHGLPAGAEPGLDAQTYRPAMDGQGLLEVERARTGTPGRLGLKLGVDYAAAPLSLPLPDGANAHEPFRGLLTLHLGTSYAVSRRFALALDLPVTRTVGREGAAATTARAFGPVVANDVGSNAGPADLRLAGKVALVSDDRFGLGALLALTAPFGDERAFLGAPSWSLEPRVMGDVRLGPVTLAANAGLRFLGSRDGVAARDAAGTSRLVVAGGHELNLAAAVAVALSPSLSGQAEYARTDIVAKRGAGTTANAQRVLAGLEARPRQDLAIGVAAGPGLGTGLRSEELRVLFSLSWLPGEVASRDRDGDGIPDASDGCPEQPEDRDGFADEDGCPDADNDEDGIADKDDRCPALAEDRDNFEDADGCPDRDNDDDGVPDVEDRCPDEPEDRDGFEDADGCPDRDNDGDGITDADDRCPDEPESKNGIDDEDGCPDGGQLRRGLGSIPEVVRFQPGNATLSGGALALVDRIAERLRAHPRTSVRVEGHAGADAGSRAQALSTARAQAVMKRLIERGADPSRLSAVGYGAKRPIASAGTRDNDRVELIVTREDP